MKKIIVIVSIALLSFTAGNNTVYVCVSKSSVAYHSTRACTGLEHCTHTINAMSEADAVKLGKRRCKLCWQAF